MTYKAIAAAMALLATAGAGVHAAEAPWVLTPYGLGPIRIGMTPQEVGRVVGHPIHIGKDADSQACSEVDLPGHADAGMMFENGKLTRFFVFGRSRLHTAEGIGIGATEAAVKAAYPKIERSDADYDEAPAANLIQWTQKDVAGLEFRTGADGKVVSIAAGGHSIEYYEGCD